MLSAEQQASSFCKQFSLRPPGKAKVENKSLVDSLTPSSLSSVVFCAPFALYPVPKSVRYSQHCLEGVGGDGH